MSQVSFDLSFTISKVLSFFILFFGLGTAILLKDPGTATIAIIFSALLSGSKIAASTIEKAMKIPHTVSSTVTEAVLETTVSDSTDGS
jgi:hypothetical protein